MTMFLVNYIIERSINIPLAPMPMHAAVQLTTASRSNKKTSLPVSPGSGLAVARQPAKPVSPRGTHSKSNLASNLPSAQRSSFLPGNWFLDRKDVPTWQNKSIAEDSSDGYWIPAELAEAAKSTTSYDEPNNASLRIFPIRRFHFIPHSSWRTPQSKFQVKDWLGNISALTEETVRGLSTNSKKTSNRPASIFSQSIGSCFFFSILKEDRSAPRLKFILQKSFRAKFWPGFTILSGVKLRNIRFYFFVFPSRFFCCRFFLSQITSFRNRTDCSV